MQPCRPHQHVGPCHSSAKGHGRELWPHSPPIPRGPSMICRATTTPLPHPVPRMTPRTRVSPAAGAVDRFRQRETIGVVRKPHARPQPTFEVGSERASVEPGRVGVLNEPGARRDRPGHPDPDPGPGASSFGFQLLDDRDERHQRRLVVALAAMRCATPRACDRRGQWRSPRSSSRRDRSQCERLHDRSIAVRLRPCPAACAPPGLFRAQWPRGRKRPSATIRRRAGNRAPRPALARFSPSHQRPGSIPVNDRNRPIRGVSSARKPMARIAIVSASSG